MVEEFEDEYGKNYKFYYEIEDKEKIDKDDLKDLQEELRDLADEYYDEVKDIDNDDLEDWADDADLKLSDAKKLKNEAVSLCKKAKKAKITAGYELDVTYYVKGSELDEPEELYEATITVYKVNGKWVSYDTVVQLVMRMGFSMFY